VAGAPDAWYGGDVNGGAAGPRPGLVLIPAFNEAARLGAVVERVRAVVPDLEVLVVDDGSADATSAAARRRGARVLRHPFNLGYGAALHTGYKYAARHGYAFVVQLDADGQHDPADVPRLLAPLARGEADVVVGSRFVRPSGYRMGWPRSLARSFFRRVLVLCGGPRIADPTSGFQALSAAAVRFCCGEFYPTDFPDIDVLLLLHRRGFRILEVPVDMAPSPPGRVTMHAGAQALYYPYKMLLATFRSVFAPPARAAETEPES
jgi:hypothetical protein